MAVTTAGPPLLPLCSPPTQPPSFHPPLPLRSYLVRDHTPGWVPAAEWCPKRNLVPSKADLGSPFALCPLLLLLHLSCRRLSKEGAKSPHVLTPGTPPFPASEMAAGVFLSLFNGHKQCWHQVVGALGKSMHWAPKTSPTHLLMLLPLAASWWLRDNLARWVPGWA